MPSLYNKLKLLASYNIKPSDVRIIIDEQPIIDTENAKDKNALLMADLVLKNDETANTEKIRNAFRVIYWKIIEEDPDISIAGIAWMEEMNARFFAGTILTP